MVKKITFLLLLISSTIFAQDTLVLLNGKYKYVVVDSMDYDFVFYKKIKKSGKEGSRKRKNLDHVYAIDYKEGERKLIYQKDSLLDNFWSPSQMEYYLEGRRQARKHFKPFKTALIGAGVGTGIALYSLFPIKYGAKEKVLFLRDTITNSVVPVRYTNQQALTVPVPFWEVIPMGVYVYYAGTAPDGKKFKADDKEMFKNEVFMIGYKETVVDRKVFAAVGSCVGSFLTTILGYMIFDPLDN